jgi:hypothetical protein
MGKWTLIAWLSCALSWTLPASAQPAAEPQPPATGPEPAAEPAPAPAPPPEATQQPAPPPAGPPPAAHGYGPPPAGYGGPPPAYGAPPLRPERAGFVPVLHLGLVIGGGGEREYDCSGDGCGGSSDSEDYDDKTNLVFGADFLGHLSPNLRLGGGLLFAPSTQAEDDDGDADLGSDLSIFGIVEGVFDAGPTVAFAVRGFVGVAMLFAGGDLEDQNDRIEESCKSDYLDCDFDEGSSFAFTFGIGAGLIVGLDSVGLRFDLVYQRYSGTGRTVNYSDTYFDAKIEEQISGGRALLLAGLEF